MTIREFYEAVPDEHKDDIMCVYDKNHALLKSQIFGQHRFQGHRSGALEEV